MRALSQSFRMGTGSIEHNLRICKGRGVRQNGILERRGLNEQLVDVTATSGDELLRATVVAEIGDKLNALNAHHIETGHPERVRTVDDWIKAQRYERQGQARQVVHEYIVQVGSKRSGCYAYEPAQDGQGNYVDSKGVIPAWDTRRSPAYKDGRLKESAICKQLKKVYRDYLQAFKEANPHARVLCASIHADEKGGVHMHINVIWINTVKNGVGIGLSKTTAMRQQYAEQGVKCKNDKTDNAQNRWREDMKALLEEVALRHGISKLDMHDKSQHKTIAAYQKLQDVVCAEIQKKEQENKQKELELLARKKVMDMKEKKLQEQLDYIGTVTKKTVNRFVQQQWQWLKNKHPDWYKVIQAETVGKVVSKEMTL